jgi:hypothetical protein
MGSPLAAENEAAVGGEPKVVEEEAGIVHQQRAGREEYRARRLG